jgi:PAS domain S-box-containing protein
MGDPNKEKGGMTPASIRSRVKSLSNKAASRREQALLADANAAKQRLATVLESISDGFIALDRDWAYTALNNQACESMGMRRNKILGRRIWDLYPDTIGTRFEAELRRAVTQRETVRFDYFYPPRNRWYENRIYPSADGISIFFSDVTERKRAEEALIASEKRLAADLVLMKSLQEVSTRLVQDVAADPPLLEIVDAAIAITGADMGIIQLLDRGSGALKIVASRGFDSPFLEFFNAVHDCRTACGRAMKSGARVVIGDVTTSPVLMGTPTLDVMLTAGVQAVQATPLVSHSGQLLGVLSTQYRTPRVPADRDLHLLDVLVRQATDWIERTHSQEELRLAKKALEEADRRKDEFLAVLAHELRNPLASIMAGSRLLRRRASSALESEQTRDLIEHEVGQLSRLVDDLLDVSRITTGRVVLRHEALDLRKVVKRALESTRPLFEERKHRLQFDLPRKPVRVRGDAVRLVQVLSNLLANAAKYTPTAGTIRLTAGMTGGQAVVRILDSGMGIAPADLPRIFDLFNRIERSRDHAEGGLGIGLTLSRRLVDMHKGSLEAFSDGPGRGSEFVVRLPLVDELPKSSKGLARPRHERLTPAAGCGRGPARSRRILLVDDNKAFATAMTSLLNAMGHDVQAVHDGVAVIATARALRPQVVLLDINLPGKCGYDIAREIRADPALADTLLVAVTGYGQEDDKRQAHRAGFDHHLTKPVDETVLAMLIDEAPTD